VWATEQTAVQDLIGDGYTLLRLGSTPVDTSPLEEAMREIGAPFDAVSVDSDNARDIYGYDLLLLRPDLHVAWRGNAMPHDPARLASLVTGHP
jgi:hypothetical protein